MEFLNNRKKSLKWDKTDIFFGKKGLLPLWVADMDISSPKELRERLSNYSLEGDFGYSFKGFEFYNSIISWYKKRFDFTLHKNWILGANGVVHSICFLLELLTSEGEEIIVQSPIYPPFFKKILGLNRTVLFNSLIMENNEYKIDFENLENLITNKTKILLLCNPHNPTGKVFSEEELVKIEQICQKYNLLVISDEIHGDIVYTKKHIPFCSVSKWALNNSIILNSPAKSFNCPNLFTSYLIIGNIQLKSKVKNFMELRQIQELNSFGTEAIITLYEKCDYWLDDLLPFLMENIRFVDEFLKTKLPRIKLIKPEGTYLLWLDFKDYKLPVKEFESIFVEQCGLALSRGSDFGIEGQGFMRINIGTKKENIEIALERIFVVFSKLS